MLWLVNDIDGFYRGFISEPTGDQIAVTKRKFRYFNSERNPKIKKHQMAEFIYYCSETERIAIIESILELGDYHLIPDIIRSNDIPQIIDRWSPNDSVENIFPNLKSFLIGPFTKEMIGARQLKNGGYYSTDLEGGPALVFALPSCWSRNGVTEFGPGSLFYRQKFLMSSGDTIKPDVSLKAHYGLLVGQIKKHLIRRKIDKYHWIGAGACRSLEEKRAILLNRGRWFHADGSESVRIGAEKGDRHLSGY